MQHLGAIVVPRSRLMQEEHRVPVASHLWLTLCSAFFSQVHPPRCTNALSLCESRHFCAIAFSFSDDLDDIRASLDNIRGQV